MGIVSGHAERDVIRRRLGRKWRNQQDQREYRGNDSREKETAGLSHDTEW